MVATELAPGTVIGARYRLERFLGEGGMGAVWVAEDTASGRRCALKLMKDAAGDPEARKRFLREGRAASAVRHRNVVGIFEVLEPEGESPAIAMELLEGESLRAMLRRQQQLTLAELAEIMAPVVSAVGAAHALGIVHRDLKPENIFLARGAAGERVVKVLDFGIAKLTALDGEAIRSTGITTGAVLGTPAYMAPEQVFAEKDLDHRADIWALGVIFYECLAGACPTEGENVGQVLKHVVSKPFEPLGERVPELPAEVSALVARMLAREPSRRPADLHEVIEVLEPFASAPGAAFGAPAPPATSGGPPTEPARRAGALAATVPLGRNSRPAGAIDPLAKTVHGEAPRPRRSRHRAALWRAGGLLFFAIGAALLARWCWPAPPVPPPSDLAGPSPLDPPESKLACPILRASGADAPAGWLGAAAAGVACERARLILGGRVERTLVPAELLDLPREPVDTFPADPYGAPDARDRSLAGARQRAQAYLDGEVVRSATGFTVTLVLHRADGRELARATRQGRGLYEAVRAAMAPLVGSGSIPKAKELEPGIAAWSRTGNVDDALGVIDLTFAFAHNAGGLPEECRRFDELSPRVGELGPEGRWLCAYTLGQPLPQVRLDDSDRSAAGAATRIRIDFIINKIARSEDVELVHGLFEREGTARGRSLLAAVESCLLGATKSARETAIVAVRSEPKNPEGGWCNPWEQLVSLERDAMGADGTVRAMQAWVPWNSYAWLEPGFVAGAKDPAVLPLLRRAYALSPFDAQIALTLAGSLLASGERVGVRGIAAALRAGGLPLHRVGSELILVRVDTSIAHFGEALERARKLSELSLQDNGWIRAQRFESAWHALEVAILLGRGREVADLLVKRFIEPEPAPLDSFQAVPMRIPAICALASASDRCFERFRTLRQQIPALTQETDAFITGAERYAKQDFAGAAKAWRPLLGGRMVLATMLPDAMVDAFQRMGAADLAERVDQEVVRRAGEFNGATMGHARAALRAARRGDRARARQLAEQVIRAWSLADEEPPVLAEMRRLVAQP